MSEPLLATVVTLDPAAPMLTPAEHVQAGYDAVLRKLDRLLFAMLTPAQRRRYSQHLTREELLRRRLSR